MSSQGQGVLKNSLRSSLTLEEGPSFIVLLLYSIVHRTLLYLMISSAFNSDCYEYCECECWLMLAGWWRISSEAEQQQQAVQAAGTSLRITKPRHLTGWGWTPLNRIRNCKGSLQKKKSKISDIVHIRS